MDVDDYLMLSAISHFSFCQRQCALIHVEQVWADNVLTFEGNLMHEKANSPEIIEIRNNIIISRALPLVSHTLKIYGVCDTVEFHKSSHGAKIAQREGIFQIIPVEYKHGKKGRGDSNEVQLCAQALCLEEMFSTSIEYGFLFYGKTRRREKVVFDESIRERVRILVVEIYEIFRRGITPPPDRGSWCQNCSLHDVCIPTISKLGSVHTYMQKCLNEE